MAEKLHSYQTNFDTYFDQVCRGYNILAKEVEEHLGGFADKTVLDLGVGFQLIHGGLVPVLSLQAGAKRCFGIDIAHPALHSHDPMKVEFWKVVQKRLGIEIQGLDQGRVEFASTDILHFDEFYSKIEFLQMSASDMWFKDNMFDVVVSNAVFEHVQKPQEVLNEVARVLKPGGGGVFSWNPYSGLRMGGHDVGLPYYHPWAHLRLNEEEHVAALKKVFSTPDLYNTAFPKEHTPQPERAAVYAEDPALFRKQIKHDLNEMRIPEFIEYVENAGLELVASKPLILDEDRPYLTDEIRAELPEYSDEELLNFVHIAVVRKPIESRMTREPESSSHGRKKSLMARLLGR